MRKKIKQVLALIICLLLFMSLSISKDHRLFGMKIAGNNVKEQEDSVISRKDGYIVVSTKNIAKDIIGYSGNIPLDVYLKNGKIEKIEILENTETPGFLKHVVNTGLLTKWNDLSPVEAAKKKVDAVSGATYSSDAIIQSVKRAMNYVNKEKSISNTFDFDAKFIIVLLVVLGGLIIPYVIKSKLIRNIQLILNVAVLGFWSGSFVSMSMITKYVSNGLGNVLISAIPLLLIFAAFILPLFGKSNQYCMWLCPMGSLQELIGKIIPYKIRLSCKTVKYLNYFRRVLWIAIMFIIWSGVSFDIMNYEVFSAFLIKNASLPVLVMAVVFLILSGIIHRPYCRFVCPTGTFMKLSHPKK